MSKILECSSRGDKRFSAFYAYVNVFGRYDSIEKHYQSCKRFSNGELNQKGVKPTHIVINEINMDIKYLTPYYKLLWVKYLDSNPDLVEYLFEFDDFSDMFKGRKTINCQADVIRQYIKQGRKSIMNEYLVIELINILKNKRKDSQVNEQN